MTIDGVSLTVVSVDRHAFEVSLIQFTQAEATVLSKKAGDAVNIECDIIGKYVEKLAAKEKLDMNFLAENGF